MEGEGTAGDEPGYNPTPEDLLLWEVYGDWVNANPGTHLDGSIRDDLAWQAWWHDLAVILSRRYDAPIGRVGSGFVRTLGVELSLSDGDPATIPTCHRIPGHMLAYRKETGCLGVGAAFHAGGGHAASVWGIYHRCPEGGGGGAPGTNVPQPGAPWEALDGSAVDNRTRDGRSTTTRGPVHKDRGPSDGGAPRQTPGGPDTDRGESGIVP